jgi:hypothetical protein
MDSLPASDVDVEAALADTRRVLVAMLNGLRNEV